MTREERKLALYCLKASSDYHSEVCEECTKYPNCDHTGQDDVTETIIKALEQEPSGDLISRQAVLDIDFRKLIHTTAKPAEMIRQIIEQLPLVNPQEPTIGQLFSCEEIEELRNKI